MIIIIISSNSTDMSEMVLIFQGWYWYSRVGSDMSESCFGSECPIMMVEMKYVVCRDKIQCIVLDVCYRFLFTCANSRDTYLDDSILL